MDVVERARQTIEEHQLADAETPALLMVSGGSDSTALAYVASELHKADVIGPIAMIHVNHLLRGKDADDDAKFVEQLADTLDIPFYLRKIDVARIAKREGGNIEAIARRERYQAAHEALSDVCRRAGAPTSTGRIFTAHTADDRIENFYMRSIVGTGPGGFRSMLYLNGLVARPFLDIEHTALRSYVRALDRAGAATVHDSENELWREDATNEHTDRFRAYVRHKIVPRAKERNPKLAETLGRTMNLIAEEDDFMNELADELVARHVTWLDDTPEHGVNYDAGCVIDAELASVKKPLARRTCMRVLKFMLGDEARVETATVDAVLAGYNELGVNSGYVTNVQGNLAISANKQGVRIEPMADYRARRNRG